MTEISNDVDRIIDMDAILGSLAEDRPVFHSESDFKHALSWRIQQDHPDVRVRQEVGNLIEGPDRRYVDTWLPDSRTAIEIKYLTRTGVITHWDEEFRLKNQSAQDLDRYGFCLDISRLEEIVRSGKAANGYAILLTNDHLYWNPPGKPGSNDAEFVLHEDREITGTLAWGSNAGAGTLKGRENPIEIAGKYTPRWREYSDPPGDRIHRVQVPAVACETQGLLTDGARGTRWRRVEWKSTLSEERKNQVQRLLLPATILFLVILAALAAWSDPTPAPETLPTTSTPAPSASPTSTETPVPTESQAEKPTTATTAATTPASPTPPGPTATPAPPGVLAPLHALDSGATLSELSDAELECIGENPERQTRFFGCLEDETLARVFLAGFVPGPEPLSQETSDCVRDAFAVIDPRAVMTAGLEGDPGRAMAGSMAALSVTVACLTDQEWEETAPHVGDESGRTGRDAVPDRSTGGSGTDGSSDDSDTGRKLQNS